MSEVILRFVHISDTHISDNPDYGRQHTPHSTQEGARALVQQLKNLPFKPDFVLHTGDVAFDPEPSAYNTALAILSEIPYPVYYVGGNHDYPVELQRIMLGRAETTATFHYETEINGVQLIVLDSDGHEDPPRGIVTPDQIEWLGGLCNAQDDRPLVVAVHHNVLPVGIPWLDDYMILKNGEAVHQALLPARHRLRGVFFGHVHQNIDLYRDGILYSSTLSTWNQFVALPDQVDTIPETDADPGFSVVTLTRDTTYIRRCRYRFQQT